MTTYFPDRKCYYTYMHLQNKFLEKQEEMQKLESELIDPSILSDTKKLREANEAYAAIKEVVRIGKEYNDRQNRLEETKTLLTDSDPEIKEMANQEITLLETEIPEWEQKFTVALIPPDPLDKKNIIIEIRAGTGGDEAALFASDLFRMYSRFAERQEWKTELISGNRNDVGGFKEIVFSIKGNGAYSMFKYESGVHRVQRVPETEKQGRVHTSTATVAVLPEVEEVDFKLEPKDLKIEATTSTGAGGQSVNTAYSAIRITHLPTGLMVYCQDERSQKQNKEKAMNVIRARVFAHEEEKRVKERADERKTQIGTGERSEKIRTYNYPQDRITDHRIKESWHNLPDIMDGNIYDVIQSLISASINAQLSQK